MKRRGADVVVQALEDAGARFAFGIPGTHNIDLYDALDASSRVRPVLVTDEQGASFMADGVSRTSDVVGVVNVVPGAGVTHALSGIAQAYMDNIPLVVIATGVRSDTGHAYQVHDIDQLAVLRPVVKQVTRVEDPARLYPEVRRAFDLARAGCPGPVAVEIPANLTLFAHDVPAAAADEPPPPPAAPADEDLDQAARLLQGARQPAIYAGYGARAATDQLRELAERLGAPVCTTFQGKGVFPESHPLWLWNGFGPAAPRFVRRIMDRCDVLLAVGCRFGEVATGSYGLTPPDDLIHVDIEPEVLGRNYPARLGVAADASAFLEGLLPRLEPRDPDDELRRRIAEGHRAVVEDWRAHPSRERVTPAVLLASLQRHATEDAVFATDSGNGTFLAAEHLRLEAPGRFIAPVDYSCMGYAVPAAIGAKLAGPERDVIALEGDGALLMTGLELLAAASQGVAPLVCVLRDGEYHQISQFQRTALGKETCSVLPDYEVGAFARVAGCAHEVIGTDAEVDDVVARALERTRGGEPVMVEVAIDYSRKTYFNRGIILTNFLRLSWGERVRRVKRVAGRTIGRLATGKS